MKRRNLPGRSSTFFLIACGLLASIPAAAGVPSPPNWDVPPRVLLVGEDGSGDPDPLGEFLIHARDLANNPLAGILVTIDFSNCSDVRLGTDQRDPDVIINCALRTVSKRSDANGFARFRVVGSNTAAPGSPGNGPNCAQVLGDGVVISHPQVAILDLSGSNGLNPADLSAWLDDFFGGNAPERADYDVTGDLGPADLSYFLDAFFASGSVANFIGGVPCAP